MNNPKITNILQQFSTEEICKAYLHGEECPDWEIDGSAPWLHMPKRFFVADLFRRLIILEETAAALRDDLDSQNSEGDAWE